MISQQLLDTAVQRLVTAYEPLQIYLYGDYAWGTPTEDSSVDLLLVVESSDERIIKRGYQGFEALLGLRIPHRLVVFTAEEFAQYTEDKQSATYDIKTRGKVLYART